jgi:protein-L-isoaspartate(D-aspartate) O-methyltransferase
MNGRYSLAIAIVVPGIWVFLSCLSQGQSERQWDAARERLVKLVSDGVQDPRVLESVGATKRHLFVPPSQRKNAYFDMALPIGSGATISPPHIVAFMTEQLNPQPTDRVLEIGTGSGYQAAILSPLVADVFSIEIIEEIGRSAAERLKRLGYQNIHTRIGDGFQGWPEYAPFDKIVVTCSPEDIPAPLVDQLKEGGQMVIPVGRRFQQALCLITKRNGNLERKVLESTFFIPMTGRAEELRSKRADDGVPELINGGFEDAIDPNVPAGWYYLRQLRLVTDSESPEGNTFVALANRTPDRAAQALQAFGIDGRRFQEIRISAMVRRKSIRLVGRNGHSGIDISFYDERRARVGAKRIGPWTGSAKWTLKTSRLRVPPNARLAVLAIGLFGATGELSIDKLQVRP